MSSRRVLLCLLALVIAPMTLAPLAGTTGRVSGRVTGESGEALSGVDILVRGPGAVGIYRTRTDAEGLYHVPGLPLLEKLEVRASLDGMAPVVYQGLTAREGSGTRRDFRLRSAGSRAYVVAVDMRVPYHAAALEGLRTSLPVTPRVMELTGNERKDGKRLRELASARPSAVVAVGREAARLARRWIRDVPIVHTMSLDTAPDGLEATNLCGIPLNGGHAAQLNGLLSLVPGARRVATIYNPQTLSEALQDLRAEVSARGLELIARPARTPRRAIEQIRTLEGTQLDAFYLLLDPEVIDIEVFEEIRRFSERHALAFIVPDRSLVVAGGTFSLAPGFRELGAHAGEVAEWIVSHGVAPAEVATSYPSNRYFMLNPNEAQRLGILTPEATAGSTQRNQVEDGAVPGVKTP